MPLPKVPQEILSIGDSLGVMYNIPTVAASVFHNNLWDISNKYALDYLMNDRKLTEATIRQFRLGIDDKGYITIPIYKDEELIDYKFRSVKEKMFHRVDKSQTWVINEKAFASAVKDKYIIITEGEFDTMAVWQLGLNSVISGTGGAQEKGMAWIIMIPPEVEKVFINYDNDEPGKKAARELAERIGIERCYNVVLPQKDANDFVKEGGTLDEYKRILRTAPRFNIEGVMSLGEVLDDIRKNKIERLSINLERFNAYTKGGIPKKSLVVLSGRTGIGKSTALMNFLIYHADHGHPCLLISLENDIAFTQKRLLEIKYKTPYSKFTEELWSRIKIEMLNYPLYIDVSGKTTTFEAVDKMVAQAKQLYGIEVLGFDHIHYVLEGKYNVTQEVATMTKNFKLLSLERDVIVYLISHIRKIKEEGSTITGEDLKDSSALQQLADMVLLLLGSKTGMGLSIDKSRMSRSHLLIPVLHDGESGVIKDDMNRVVTSFGEKIIDDTAGMVDIEPAEPVDEGYIE